MQKLQGFTQQGNTALTISGSAGSITRKVEGSFPSATITVYLAGTLTLASIFSDNASLPTARANPFVSASDGTFFFYAANGRYDVKFSGGGLSAPFTLGDFLFADPQNIFVDITAAPYYADPTGVVDAIALITAALATGLDVYIPPGTFKITTQIVMFISGQRMFGAGNSLSKLNFTGSGFAISYNDKSKCVVEDLEIQTADEGVDFKITASNCLSNILTNVTLQGPGRSATSATTRRGVIFRRMIGALAVFFNTTQHCFITGFDEAVDFDAPNGSPTIGGNANNALNVRIEHCWYGYMVKSIENTISGGFFNSTGGNSSSDYFVGYKFTNNAAYNVVSPSIGEPGTNSAPYIFDAGTNNNVFPLLPFNYDLGGSDLGDRNTVSQWMRTYTRSYLSLAENHYYSIPISDAMATNYVAALAHISWSSRAPGILSSSSGYARVSLTRDTAVSASILENTFKLNAVPVRFAGVMFTANVPKIVFYVGNNGTATSTSRLDASLQGIEGLIPLFLGPTATDEGTVDPSTVSASPVYTPTLTNNANISASTAYPTTFYRTSGNCVEVFGRVDITTTAAAGTLTTMHMSLPLLFPSTLTSPEQLSGQANDVNQNDQAGIYADTSARFEWRATVAAAHVFFFRFSYRILP